MESELNKKLLDAIEKNKPMYSYVTANECEKICLQFCIDKFLEPNTSATYYKLQEQLNQLK